jgi:hypothetical protein
MPELNIRHQRFVLLRANPIVVRLFCVALTQRIDECKLSHDPIFGVDGIFKRKRVRSIVVCIVDCMAPVMLDWTGLDRIEPDRPGLYYFIYND